MIGGKGSGRKGSERDAQLLRDLRNARQNQPPRKVVKSWKSSVRKANAKKKR